MNYRLPPDLQDDLTWYWCSADSLLGVKSSTGSQIGVLERRSPPPKPPKDLLVSLAHWRAASPEEREGIRRFRWQRADDALRAMWQTISCHEDGTVETFEDPMLPWAFERTPLPAWARTVGSHDRARVCRVHRTLTRVVKSPSGPAHERVLHRVYGSPARHPVCYGRVGAELAPLVEYTPAVSALIEQGMPTTEAGERVLHKATDLVVATVRRQANDLLEAASTAYKTGHYAALAEAKGQRRARFKAILGAA